MDTPPRRVQQPANLTTHAVYKARSGPRLNHPISLSARFPRLLCPNYPISAPLLGFIKRLIGPLVSHFCAHSLTQ